MTAVLLVLVVAVFGAVVFLLRLPNEPNTLDCRGLDVLSPDPTKLPLSPPDPPVDPR